MNLAPAEGCTSRTPCCGDRQGTPCRPTIGCYSCEKLVNIDDEGGYKRFETAIDIDESEETRRVPNSYTNLRHSRCRRSMTVLDDLPVYRDALASHMSRIARPGTEVVLHGVHAGTFPADYPVDDNAYPYISSLHSHQWAAAAINAQRQGFDAYAMCTLPAPMIREIRTL
eukprot:gene27118-48638_t